MAIVFLGTEDWLPEMYCSLCKKSFAEQIISVDTIYEIRYNFDLGGNRVAIPADCVLKYVGGSLSNGTIVYNNTIVEGIERLNNVVTEGEFKYPYTSPDKEEGGSTNEQLAPTLAKIYKLSTEVTNIADDEDLTKIRDLEKGQDVLQLKDRHYSQDSNNGMGYVIIRQNKSFAEQVIEANTIYEIRYDFDLDGFNADGTAKSPVTIPENCVLKFEGGSLRNGNVRFNNTKIEGTVNIDARIEGIIFNKEVYIQWFNLHGDGINDDSQKLSDIVNCLNKNNTTLIFEYDKIYLHGDGLEGELGTGNNYNYASHPPYRQRNEYLSHHAKHHDKHLPLSVLLL